MSNHEPTRDPGPDLEPPLEAAVWSILREPIDTDAVARVAARAETILPEGLPIPTGRPLAQSTRLSHPILSRRVIVKSLSTVAAAVIVVGTLFLLQPSSSAFAEAIRQLRQARSLTYVNRVYTEANEKPAESRVYLAKDGRQRTEFSAGQITICDAANRKWLTLHPDSKTATSHEFSELQQTDVQSSRALWLEQLRAHGEKPDKQLGSKTLDGREVAGFIARQGKYSYTVWVDSKTNELVQVEHEMFVKGTNISRVVMTDFQFDRDLDESLFSLEIPAGYKLQKVSLPKVLGGEQSIVEALRGFTKHSAGKFPKSITDWGEWAVQLSQPGSDNKAAADTTTIMSHLGSTMPFLVNLDKADYAYIGAGKTTKDERCIVFWHKTQDGKFRAIFNDLSVKEVEKEDLP